MLGPRGDLVDLPPTPTWPVSSATPTSSTARPKTAGCTPLGTLATRDDLRAAPGKPVTVLIRPEQLEIRPGADGPGARGRVIGTSFHGHDTLIRVRAGSQAGPSPILVRVHGNPQLMPGSAVTLTVREPVSAWLCDDRTR